MIKSLQHNFTRALLPVTLIATSAMLAACGGSDGDPPVKLEVKINGAPATTNSQGQYIINHFNQVEVTCLDVTACTFVPAVNKASYQTPDITKSRWRATFVSTAEQGTFTITATPLNTSTGAAAANFVVNKIP